MRQGGFINCEVTGSRHYSADLAQGGLEIPRSLTFTREIKEVQKVQRLLKPLPSTPDNASKEDVVLENSVKAFQSPGTTVMVKDSSTALVKIGNSLFASVSAVEFPNTSVTVVQCPSTDKANLPNVSGPNDLAKDSCVAESTYEPSNPKKFKKGLINSKEGERIRNGDMLSDLSMNEAQRLLKLQFPKIKGL